jgi:NADH pyrophosphatase NudC (nudix superfamily)
MKFCPECSSGLTKVELEGVERTACSSPSCTYVFWNNPTPVVAAIVEHSGKIVLARKKGWPDFMFGVIAGFLEKGETPETAVLREIKEEIGLEGSTPNFIGNYSFFERNQLIIAFHVKAEGSINIGDELDEIKCVLPEEITPWSHGTGPAVKDWLEKRIGGEKKT